MALHCYLHEPHVCKLENVNHSIIAIVIILEIR